MKYFLILLFSAVSLLSTAQFSLGGVDDYIKKRAEEAEQQRIQDSIRLADLEAQRWKENDVRYRIQWVNMVSYRQTVGLIQNSYNLSYYGYLTSKDEWTYPISLRLIGSESFNEQNLSTGVKDWSQWVTELGMSGFRKLHKEQYLSLGLHLPLGFERYRTLNETTATKKHWHGLIGLRVEERLMYISDRKTGLMMSAGFYQLLLNSKRYHFDAGFSLEVGIKF